MRRLGATMIGLTCLAVLSATAQESAAPAEYALEQVSIVEGFSVPECLRADPENGVVYVSNVDAAQDEYWTDDGKGFISLMTSDGIMKELRWLESTPDAVLNGPKGSVILNGCLYIADIGRLLRCPIKDRAPIAEVPLPHTKRLNDLATDGQFLYASDTELGIVYKVGPKGGQTIIQAPPMVNGVTCWRGKIFAVGWEPAEVYELDPSGDNPPVPFGLTEHFTALDGIEILEDGTFIVSDFEGGKICSVTPDRKTVSVLAELDSPADIGIDLTRNLLYVPQFMQNKAVIYRLSRK